MSEIKHDRDIAEALNQYKESGYRVVIHVSGNIDFCIEQAHQIIYESNLAEVIWLGLPESSSTQNILHTPQQLKTLLGTEIDSLVINAFDGFNPCALGIASGCIRAGGVLILLTPKESEWVKYADPDYGRMLSDEHHLSLVSGRFIQHALDSLSANVGVWRIRESTNLLLPDLQPQKPFVRNYTEQKEAVSAIKRVVTGHARRPLVLQADRGRGKSAALGIAAAELMKERDLDIIITASGRDAVNTLFDHAAQQLDINDHSGAKISYEKSSLCFVPVDQLVAGNYKAGVLFIDEAAAIPSALLSLLLDKFNRVVFSTTVHGYEGNGRGFAIRFRDVLNKKMPQWRLLELQSPIRWAPEDPLERLCNELLLLQAEPAVSIQHPTPVFSFIDRDDLLHNKYRLQQIFGLLITAHYQTSPDDLRILLDHPDVSIVIAEQDGEVFAVALVMNEGGFGPEGDINPGDEPRRVRGHLIPQALAVSGFNEALNKSFQRILRIAVQPEIQGQGVGQALVKYIENNSKADYLGASFSAEPAVIGFWKKTGMQAVRLGIHKESSTGQYACIVLKSLREEANALFDRMISSFAADIAYQLLSNNGDISPATVIQLLKGMPVAFDGKDLAQCRAYLNKQRSFETVQVSLYRVYLSLLCNDVLVNQDDKNHWMMIEKLLLNHSWKEVCGRYSYTGRKAAELEFRKELSLLLL